MTVITVIALAHILLIWSLCRVSARADLKARARRRDFRRSLQAERRR